MGLHTPGMSVWSSHSSYIWSYFEEKLFLGDNCFFTFFKADIKTNAKAFNNSLFCNCSPIPKIRLFFKRQFCSSFPFFPSSFFCATGGLPKTLHEVEIPMVDHEQCRVMYIGEDNITPNMICAAPVEGGKGPCGVSMIFNVFHLPLPADDIESHEYNITFSPILLKHDRNCFREINL